MSQNASIDIAVLILAAGSSSRMGRPKQLLTWKGGTLLGHSIKVAQVLTQNFVVVLGAHEKQISPLVPKKHVTVNSGWKIGIGSSIAHGVQFLEAKYEPHAVLIQLVDQPLLKLAHYKNLIHKHRANPSKIVCTAYTSRNGVPAIFPKRYFEELKRLNADFGARKFLNGIQHDILSLQPIGRLTDLDTPEDYDFLLSSDSDE